jgi:hypothetical protein
MYDAYYSRSTDDGETWAECSADNRLTVSNRSFVSISAINVGSSIWLFAADATTGDIFLRTTPDDGVSWTTTEIFLQATATIGATNVSAIADEIGIWVFFAGWGDTDGIYYVRSDSQGGGGWGSPVQAIPGPYRSPCASKSDGIYRLVTTDFSSIWYHNAIDPESSDWFSIQVPGSSIAPSDSCIEPYMMFDSDRTLWMAYALTSSAGNRHIAYAAYPDTGSTLGGIQAFTSAQTGSNLWWDSGPAIIENGEEVLIFIASERTLPTSTRAAADILMFRVGKRSAGRAHYEIIQPAIDASIDDDSVLVHPGTYRGDGNRDLDFRGTNLVLKSVAGAEVTIVDAEWSLDDSHGGFYFQNGEDSSAVVDGFTVSRAKGEATSLWYSAIICSGASPTITDCIITENPSRAIQTKEGARPHLHRCEISHNGGGIEVGVYSVADADIVISESVVHSNAGWGVYLAHIDSTVIVNSTIVLNSWGGIFCNHHQPGDKADDPAETFELTGSLICFNGPQGVWESPLGGGYEFKIRCSNSYGGNAWHNVPAYHGDSLGNLSVDPMLCDTTAQVFTLVSTSPCLPANNSCQVLIGALGAGCAGCGDVDASQGIDIDDIVFLIEYVFGGGPAPYPLLAGDTDCSGEVDIDDIVLLITYVFGGGGPPCADCF